MKLIDIDIEIAVRLFDWEWIKLGEGRVLTPPVGDPRRDQTTKFISFDGNDRLVPAAIPSYSRDKGLMMKLMQQVSKATGGKDWNFTFTPKPGGYICMITGKHGHFSAEAPAMPLAACLASIELIGGPKIKADDVETA